MDDKLIFSQAALSRLLGCHQANLMRDWGEKLPPADHFGRLTDGKSATPFWHEDTISSWCQRQGLEYDWTVLRER